MQMSFSTVQTRGGREVATAFWASTEGVRHYEARSSYSTDLGPVWYFEDGTVAARGYHSPLRPERTKSSGRAWRSEGKGRRVHASTRCL